MSNVITKDSDRVKKAIQEIYDNIAQDRDADIRSLVDGAIFKHDLTAAEGEYLYRFYGIT